MPAFRIGRINSITGIALLTFTLAILPLVLALLTSTIYVNRLNTQGQSAIHQATVITHASQELAEFVIAMERSARQYSVLLDEDLFTVYLDQRVDFNESLHALKSLPVSDHMRALLAEVTIAEESTHAVLQSTLLGANETTSLITGFAVINEKTRIIRDEGEQMISLAIENLQNSSERAKNLMLWQLAGMVPVLALTTFMVIAFILKPIRHLDKAIRRLGKGELDSPIVVNGSQDLRELGESLDWMRQRIRELENQKTIFLRHMSHELKTPLTNLREGSELLSEGIIGSLNKDQSEVAQLLQYNTLRLQEQIENLLNFSTAQSQQLTLALETFDVSQLVEAVLKDNQLAIRSKELRTTNRLEAIPISADREKLRMVIDNMLSNAVKYSPVGGELVISVEQADDQVSISVGDSGPGIPADEQERIFDAFFQGAKAPDSVVKGTGIGLSICRAFTELHGGKIFVKKTDKGATLCVMIPHRKFNSVQENG